MTWMRAIDGGVVLALHCQPGARRSEAVGLHGERLKVRIAAPPVDGRANEALVAWLAATLGVPRSAITLLAGQSGREKLVEVKGVGMEAVIALLDVGGGKRVR
jgi:hypothetical protein